MTDRFTVYAYDINTNTRLTELPAGDLQYDTRLNDAGAIQLTAPLTSRAAAALAAPIMPYLGQAPFALYVDRDGVIVWSGWATDSNYDAADKTLTITGREWLDYFSHRVIARDYDQAHLGTIPPNNLIYTALVDAQDTTLCGPGASVGITVVNATSNLPAIAPGYSRDQYITVGQLVNDLTGGITAGTGGCDISIDAAWSTGGVPVKTATLWVPRVGRIAGVSGLLFDLDVAAGWTWPVTLTGSGNRIIGIGAGTGGDQIIATAQDTSALGGLGQPPRLDLALNWTNVQTTTQLQQMTSGAAQMWAKPIATPTVTVTSRYRSAPLGSWRVGDDARIRCRPNERFPQGLDMYLRIVQTQVTVPTAGVPTVTNTFNPPPVY